MQEMGALQIPLMNRLHNRERKENIMSNIRTAAIATVVAGASLLFGGIANAATGENAPGNVISLSSTVPTCHSGYGALKGTNHGPDTITMSVSHLAGADFSLPDATFTVAPGKSFVFDGYLPKDSNVVLGIVGINVRSGAVTNFTPNGGEVEWSTLGC